MATHAGLRDVWKKTKTLTDPATRKTFRAVSADSCMRISSSSSTKTGQVCVCLLPKLRHGSLPRSDRKPVAPLGKGIRQAAYLSWYTTRTCIAMLWLAPMVFRQLTQASGSGAAAREKLSGVFPVQVRGLLFLGQQREGKEPSGRMRGKGYLRVCPVLPCALSCGWPASC